MSDKRRIYDLPRMLFIFSVLLSCPIVSHGLVSLSSFQRPVQTRSCPSENSPSAPTLQKLRLTGFQQSFDLSSSELRRILYPLLKCIDPPSGAALASSSKSKQRRLSALFATLDNSATASSDLEQKASIARKLFTNTFGRLWHALVYLFKSAFVKPFQAIKNVVAKGNSEDKGIEQYKESTTDLRNRAALNELKNANENDKTTIAQPNELDVATVQLAGSKVQATQLENATAYTSISSATIASKKVTSDNFKDSVLVTERPVIVSESPVIVAKNPVIVSKTPVIVSAMQGFAGNLFAAAESIAAGAESMVGSVVDSLPVKLGPKGQRGAVAGTGVDLTGKWKIIVTDEFKEEYDEYLRSLGQAAAVRSVACSIVDMTREETIQKQNGRELYIKGMNIDSAWERTLIASGSDRELEHDDTKEPVRTSVLTADSERVEAEAWWEENGKVHRSWMRGGRKFGGGDFESKRYLEKGGNVYVCESVFHPRDETRPKSHITWRFAREAGTRR